MKSRKTLALALVGSLLLSSSLAWSQPGKGPDQRAPAGHHGPAKQAHQGPSHGGEHRPRHADWKGKLLPKRYREPRYVVKEYGRYGLPAPKPGHHWVKVDNDFLLTAIATGVIVSIIAGS
ncbi:RcnB family protein [Alloalcanivorax xenomutans]|uniref:RcnB family protein n=1 Tax=Alloalcanivorax xenomutans TaxID=1094342 RepID=UPI002934598F|nr:RcnB family protein [Alloalcanivorax xenomutans]WOD26907.1 RcnB family protein [Alloalcanivorax xenomutans]